MRARALDVVAFGCVALIACASASKPVVVAPKDSTPSSATTASGTAATSARPATEPAAPERRAHARVVGETAVDLGSGQSMRLSPDGTMRIGDATVAQGLSIFLANVYETVRVGDDVIVLVGVGIVDQPNDPGSVIAVRVDVRGQRLAWRSSIGPQSFDPRPPETDWQVLHAGDRLVLLEKSRVVALDVGTGKQAWAFSSVDPTFLDGYIGALNISRQQLRFTSAALRDRELVLQAQTVDGSALAVELDLASGRRVYLKTRRTPARPRPLFAFSKDAKPFIGDDGPPPTPPPDPPPAGFDGLIVGYTTLLWNTRTARGVIVNPTRDAIEEILAAARAQRVATAPGKEVPITWTMVLDSAKVADAVIAAGSKHRSARGRRRTPPSKTVVFDYGLGLFQNGEQVDVDPVAQALGARAVLSPKDLPPGEREVIIERVPGDTKQARIVWGPIAFEDYASGGQLVFVVPLAY